MTTAQPTSASSPHLFRPLLLAVMAACVAWPLGEVVGALAPSLQPGFILVVSVLAALEAGYAHSLVRARYLSGSDLFRFRVVEYAVYYVLIRLAQLALAGFPPELVASALAAEAEGLLALLVDMPTLLILFVAILVNLMVSETMNDLDKAEALPDRDLPPDKHATSPADSLTGRFFAVGAFMLVLSGLARVRLGEVLDLGRTPVAGLVLNVLIYFVLGLVLMGRLRLALLSARWQVQGVRTPPELPARWLRYSLAFVGLAGLLAFVLPTGYTSGALGVISDILLLILTVLWLLIAAVLGLIFLPIAWLMGRLFGAQTVAPLQEVQQQIMPPSDPAQVASWLAVVRPFVIWTLVIGMVLYVVVTYLRERPELMAALRRLAPFRVLGRLWAALRHRVSGLIAAAEKYSPLAWLRERLAAVPRRAGFFRLGAAPAREQVMYYYLSLVRRAGEMGVQRRPAQTPREYQPNLAGELPEVEPEVAALTEAFVEARYSAHPLDPAAPARARALWARLRAALRDRKVNDERAKQSER
jgi:hypothetical protein